MNRSTIGFATSAQYRNLTADDLILARALERGDARVVPVVWTETQPEHLSCDLLVVRSVWDYHLRPQEFLRWLDAAGSKTKVVNPPEIVRWNSDKRYLKEIEAAGFPIPKTHLLQQGAHVDLGDLMLESGLDAVVIKPTVSASAFETHLVRAGQAAAFNPRLNALLKDRVMLVQEYVPEIETSGEWALIMVATSGDRFECTHAVNKLPRSGDFRVQHQYGGSYRLASPPQEALQIAQAVLARFAPGAVYCRADMVMRASSPVLMELELIEPLLHFELAPAAAETMAERLIGALQMT
jgi:glutathione synthase/RimK-type ligase-like ATP-grasp enzyme